MKKHRKRMSFQQRLKCHRDQMLKIQKLHSNMYVLVASSSWEQAGIDPCQKKKQTRVWMMSPKLWQARTYVLCLCMFLTMNKSLNCDKRERMNMLARLSRIDYQNIFITQNRTYYFENTI